MAAATLSRATLRAAVAALKKANGVRTEAARALGINISTFQHRLRRAEAEGISVPSAPAPVARGVDLAGDPEERREVARLRAANARLATALREADTARNELDSLRAAAIGLRGAALPPPDWLVRVPASTADAPGVPVIHLTDWHIGETVDPEQVFGANAFNEKIADQRVRACIDKVLLLAFRHIARPEYPGAVVVLGGDFVSGWLHEELLATDWCTPHQAVLWAASRLEWCLDQLRRAFGRLYVVCVAGNHGRLMKKPPAKLGTYQSHDYLIYGFLREKFAGRADVQFCVPPDGEWLFQVAGTRILAMHGHELGVKGGDGIIGAIGPIMRGQTKVGRAERSLGRDVDLLLLGHYHQHVWMPGVVVSGSLKGFDEYARRSRFSFAGAEQTLFFVHPKWGPNLPWRVYLQPPVTREPVAFVAVPEAA